MNTDISFLIYDAGAATPNSLGKCYIVCQHCVLAFVLAATVADACYQFLHCVLALLVSLSFSSSRSSWANTIPFEVESCELCGLGRVVASPAQPSLLVFSAPAADFLIYCLGSLLRCPLILSYLVLRRRAKGEIHSSGLGWAGLRLRAEARFTLLGWAGCDGRGWKRD